MQDNSMKVFQPGVYWLIEASSKLWNTSVHAKAHAAGRPIFVEDDFPHK